MIDGVMIEQVAAAFERQDYQTASQLLTQWLKQSPDDSWAQFYWGRLQEVSGKFAAAEKIYRQILRTQTNAKLIAQARQSLQRLESMHRSKQQEQRPQAIAQTQRQPAIAQTNIQTTGQTASQTAGQIVMGPSRLELGFLVLEAVTGEARPLAIQNFSQVMNVDAYTAKGVLPSRGWRLYRTGPISELQVYGTQLRRLGISTFWVSLADLNRIQVFQVNYFQSHDFSAFASQATVVCQNEMAQVGNLTFDWADVKQRVEGVLPMFGQVVDLGYRDRLEWKEHVKDYVRFCDLHLPSRDCILRIQDNKYDFHQGIFAKQSQETTRQAWNTLMANLQPSLSKTPLWSDFTLFAEMANDFATPIGRLKSHIRLSRSQDCYLDHAFHLYSGLAFLKS